MPLVCSPEKDPGDPIMNCAGPRKHRMYTDTPIYPRSLREISLTQPEVPSGIQEADRWYIVRRGWSRMPDDMRDRLVRNFANVIASGYFGGMGGLGWCLAMIERELNNILPYPIHAVVWSECEVDSRKQHTLEAFTPEHAPKYLNDCIYGRLPDNVRLQIQNWTPSKEVLLPAKLQANAKIKKLISQTYAKRGHECNTAWCVKAHKVCPLEADLDDPE